MQADMGGPIMPAALGAHHRGPVRARRGARRKVRNPGRPRSWDLMMLAAGGLLLISQARVHAILPFSLPRPALIMVVIAFGIWLVQTDPVRSSGSILTDRIGKAAFLVLVAAIIGVPFSLSIGSSARAVLESFSRTFVVFLVLAAAVRNLEDVRRLIVTFALGAAVFGAMAPVRRGGGGSIGGYDANDAAMFLVSALPTLIFCVLHGRRMITRVAAGLSVFTVIGAIVMTSPRGGFIGLVAVLGFMLLAFRGVKPVIRLGVVGAVLVLMFAVSSTDYWDRMQTITTLDDGYSGEGRVVGGRRDIWTRAVGYTLRNPLTGLGINQFSRAEGQRPEVRERIDAGLGTKFSEAHSMWFQAMAELGIPGFLAFLAMFVLSFKQLRRLQRTTLDPPPPMTRKEIQAMASTLMASLVGVMAAGSFLTHAFSGMTWGVLGIIVGFSKVGALQGAFPRASHQRRRSARPARPRQTNATWGSDWTQGAPR
jgi:hypothetical protein